MIYCDFGVLSKVKRKIMLDNVHKSLKSDGYFIFDVWSNKHAELKKVYKDWDIKESGGFWSNQPYIEIMNKTFFVEDRVSLKQHAIVKQDGDIQVYNLWEQLYTIDNISKLLKESGFKLISIYSDLTGKKWSGESECIGIIAKKI